MKKIVIWLASSILLIPIFGEETKKESTIEKKEYPLAAFEKYKDLYAISGSEEDQVKAQISFKYRMGDIHNSTFYLGFTQKVFWELYSASSPITEIEYMPDIFWRWYTDWGVLDTLDLGFYGHRSNGQGKVLNRAVDSSFLRTGLSWHLSTFKFSYISKFSMYYNIASDNINIEKYRGFTNSVSIFIPDYAEEYIDQQEVYYKLYSCKVFCIKTLSHEVGIKFRLAAVPIFRPKIFIQLFHGYADNLLIYNIRDTALRVGLTY